MRSFLVVTVFLLFLSFFSIVHAQEMQSGNHVLLPQDAVVDQDYFAAGESVTIAGTVNGDVYIAGGNIDVTGTINGDIFAAGGTVNIRGTVSDDVRVAGGQVLISGAVGKSVTAMGGSITIDDSASIDGSLVSGAGNLVVYGPIARGATIGAGTVQLGSSITGNVLAGVEQLVLTPDAVIGGDLTYYSDTEAQVQQGAVVEGEVTMKALPVDQEKMNERTEEAERAMNTAGIVTRILYLLSLYVMGTIFLLLIPEATKKISGYIAASPWNSLGMGFLILFLTPVLLLVLMMTVIGIPLALILLAGYLIYMYLSVLFASYLVGEKAIGYISKKEYSPFLILLVGLFIYGLLISIPLIGWLVSFVAMLAGMGALILVKRQYLSDFRKKKLI